MALRIHEFKYYARGVFALMFLVACSGTNSCSGCETDGTPFPDKDRVHSAIQLRITEGGLDFLGDNLEPLLADSLPEEGLSICVPGDGGSIDLLLTDFDWGYCPADCDGRPGCRVNIAIGAITLDAVEPAILRAGLTFSELDTRLDVFADGIIDCAITIDAPGFPVQIDLLLSTPDPTRDLTFSLGNPVYELSALNLNFVSNGGGFLSFSCNLVGGMLNLPIISDLIYDLIQGQVDGLLMDQIAGFVEDYTCRTCEHDAGCPSGGRCVGGTCELDGVCQPAPMGVEGTLRLGDLLADYAPGLEADLDYLASAGSYVEVEHEGLSLGMVSGAVSLRNRCVPQRPQPPTDWEPLRSDALRTNFDPLGRPYEVGVGITEEIVEHFMWATFNSGGLCLAITTDTMAQIHSGTFGLMLPGLSELTDGTSPMAITLAPQEVPIVTFGANLTEMDEDGVMQMVEPLMTIEIYDLAMDMHAIVDGRWTRVVTLTADVIIPLSLGFAPDNGIIPVLGDLTTAMTNMRYDNGEIVGDISRMEALLPALLGPLLGGATESLADPIAVPDLMGYELNLQEGSIAGIDDNHLLGLFADLERAPDAEGEGAAYSVQTEMRLEEVFAAGDEAYAELGSDAWKGSFARIELEGFDGTGEDAAMEYSWRVDNHSWTLFSPAEVVHVRSPAFLLDGRHRLQVRARRVDNYRTLDPTPAEVEVLIDRTRPTLRLVEANGVVNVEASDLLTETEDLTLRFNIGGAWYPVEAAQIHAGDLVAAGAEGAVQLTVQAMDEAGNTREAHLGVDSSGLIGRVPSNGEESGGCGCELSGRQTPSRQIWLGLLPLMFIALLRIRRRHLVALLATAGLFAGCDDTASGEAERADAAVGCSTDEQCPDNYTCDDGVCEPSSCLDEPSVCDGHKCDAGETPICNGGGVCECAPACPEGCGEGEYCCLQRGACEAIAGPCAGANIDCAPGFRPEVIAAGEMNSATCALEEGVCDCVELEPLDAGNVGRHSDLAMVDDVVWVSGYSDRYRDLVVGPFVPGQGVQWTWIDGVPADGVVEGGPSGPRGGVRTGGAKVGTHTSLAAGPEGHLHLSYRDDDDEALKYALGTPGAEGYTWQTQTLDAEGDAGLWSDVVVNAHGVPAIAYTVGDVAGQGELRYLLAKNPEPGVGSDWNQPIVVHTTTLPAEVPSMAAYPEGTGLFVTGALALDGQPTLTWYDRTVGALYFAHFDGAAFSAPELLAGREHAERGGDMGTNVDLFIDDEGGHHFCFQDGLTDSLRYLAPEAGVDEWVDDGVRIETDGREYALHVVGEDCTVTLSPDGAPIIVYQDSTSHDLLLARRDDEGNWIRTSLKGEEHTYAGAFGFYTRAVWGPQEQLWISNYVYRNHEDPAREGLEIYLEQF